MASSLEVYRQLVKSVRKHIRSEAYKIRCVEYIKNEFRNSNEISDTELLPKKLKLASDYTYLLNSVHHQKDLLFSYNIAVDRTDEMKKVLGKSAASVGLQLPEVYQP